MNNYEMNYGSGEEMDDMREELCIKKCLIGLLVKRRIENGERPTAKEGIASGEGEENHASVA